MNVKASPYPGAWLDKHPCLPQLIYQSTLLYGDACAKAPSFLQEKGWGKAAIRHPAKCSRQFWISFAREQVVVVGESHRQHQPYRRSVDTHILGIPALLCSCKRTSQSHAYTAPQKLVCFWLSNAPHETENHVHTTALQCLLLALQKNLKKKKVAEYTTHWHFGGDKPAPTDWEPAAADPTPFEPAAADSAAFERFAIDQSPSASPGHQGLPGSPVRSACKNWKAHSALERNCKSREQLWPSSRGNQGTAVCPKRAHCWEND